MEDILFMGVFIGSIAFLPIFFFFFIPYWLSILRDFGVASAVAEIGGLYCAIIFSVSTPFALRDLHSRDQFVLLLKTALIAGLAVAVASAIGSLNEYLLRPVLGIMLWNYHVVPLLFVIEALGLLAATKKFLGDRISAWYHLKPVSEGARLKQIEKYLAEADRRLSKNQFEGASQSYHSAAQVYLSLKDWANAAKYYLSSADTLSRDSPKLSYGVALLYVISASAFLLNNDMEKFNTSSMLARNVSLKVTDDLDIREQLFSRDAMSPKRRINFVLDILDKIQNRETQQLRKNWPKTTRKIEINFGPYAKELVILLKKNLDTTENKIERTLK